MTLYRTCVFIIIFFFILVTKAWNFQRITRFPVDTSIETVHTYFMTRALEQAQKVGRQGEVPIGAVIVRNDTLTRDNVQTFRILSVGANQVEMRLDASAHAELISLRRAASRQRNWRLLNCTLYSTLEPCAMCLSAALAFRIDTIVYGAPDLRLGAIVTHQQLLNQAHPFHNVSTVISGVLADESAELLRSFFRKRRQQPTASQGRRPRSEKIFFWRRRRRNYL